MSDAAIGRDMVGEPCEVTPEIEEEAKRMGCDPKVLARLRTPIRQFDGGWADTAGRYGGKDEKKLAAAKESGVWGTGDGKRLEDSDQWTFAAKTAPPPPPADAAPQVDWSGAPEMRADGSFEGYTGDGNKIVTDGNAANFGRLTDKLKEADVERRLEKCHRRLGAHHPQESLGEHGRRARRDSERQLLIHSLDVPPWHVVA